ncbi:MAG: RNA-binding protein [Suipraeoptans sp.]
MERFLKGRLVKSLCGHDKDTIYVVIDLDDRYLYLVNGKDRAISSPKKKKRKHVQYIGKAINIENCDDVRIKRLIKEALK